MDRLSKPVRRVGPALIAISLTVTSFYFLFSAYRLWSGYSWAMRRLQFSAPHGEGWPGLFHYSLLAIEDYVSLFPVYFLVGLVFGTFAVVTVIAAMNMRRKTPIVAAIAFVSGAFLFFEAYNLATRQALSASLQYFSYSFDEALFGYQTLLWVYLLSGSIAVASGIIMAILGRLKAKLREYRLKRQESNGILV